MKTALFSALLIAPVTLPAQTADPDPLAPIFESALRPTVEVMLKRVQSGHRYSNADFPMAPEKFNQFRSDLAGTLIGGLDLADHVVRSPEGKNSPIAGQFEDRVIDTITLHGITVEVHAVTLKPSGLTVPMALCLHSETPPDPVPGVAVFSGHTRHGLHDLVVNLDSYQEGAAVRLARAGFVSIAVEKIDTGYLSRDGAEGVDETELATLLLGSETPLRSLQLRACLAAVEILAAHPRVDHSEIGVTGASLGGWLSVQTALLSDRVRAVADFGRKTRTLAPGTTAALYKGQGDLCHIVPGLLGICDRNLHPAALAPLPMLAGHGEKDRGSHLEHAEHFRAIGEAQYAELNASENYRYLIHDGGDTLPSRDVIAWFQEVFEITE